MAVVNDEPAESRLGDQIGAMQDFVDVQQQIRQRMLRETETYLAHRLQARAKAWSSSPRLPFKDGACPC